MTGLLKQVKLLILFNFVELNKVLTHFYDLLGRTSYSVPPLLQVISLSGRS